MKIILFRHGEKQSKNDLMTEGEKGSITLTPLGINQITKLGKHLKTNFQGLENLDSIYSSPYPRAIQSAEIIRNILNIKQIEVKSFFSEFIAFANRNNTAEYRIRITTEAILDLDKHNESGYTFRDAGMRTLSELTNLCNTKNDPYLLLSCHAQIILTLCKILGDQKLRDEIAKKLKGDFKKSYAEAAYTVLNFENEEFEIESFNLTSN